MTKPTIPQYLKNGESLREAVSAYRQERDEALLQTIQNYKSEMENRFTVCNSPEAPAPTKPKPYRRLPVANYPTEIPGFPLNESRAGQDVPDYGTMSRVKAVKHRQRILGARAGMKPNGPPELRKRSQ